MNGYIAFIIRQALTNDPDAIVYDWFPFPNVMETVIHWSNGLYTQGWSFVGAA